MLFWHILIALFFLGHAHASEPISGVARIVDGDTLAIGETKIRLEGIDAPEIRSGLSRPKRCQMELRHCRP